MQDRSADEKLGAQSFFADFKTFTTCSILKLAKPEGQFNPQQLLEWVLAEQKNNVGVLAVIHCSHCLSSAPAAAAAAAAAAVTWPDQCACCVCCRVTALPPCSKARLTSSS
jgi:hypothetical protein